MGAVEFDFGDGSALVVDDGFEGGHLFVVCRDGGLGECGYVGRLHYRGLEFGGQGIRKGVSELEGRPRSCNEIPQLRFASLGMTFGRGVMGFRPRLRGGRI